MTVENKDTWQYCIICISWSKGSCIFDIMWFCAVRMHVTIVFFCKSLWKTTKLWIWKDVNSMSFLCEDTNPKNWFFSLFESSWNNLLDKLEFVHFWIAFSIASLRMDEWWISSQHHNLANLFVVVQSTNAISSRCQKTTFWAWILVILVLILPWWSMAEGVGYMTWEWICISLESWMVSWWFWYRNKIVWARVSYCMACISIFLVLNVHIPTYLGTRGKPFFWNS